MDPGLNQLLEWGIVNSSNSVNDSSVATTTNQNLNQNAINALFGGLSDTDLMISSMATIKSSDPDVNLEDKLVAFDNFEQLVENLDNANNIESAKLWSPLLECLDHDEGEIRKMAAWCIGTAVQNNKKCQQTLVAKGGLEKLVKIATAKEETIQIRRKAIYALSSTCRNNQSVMDLLVNELRNYGRNFEGVDATNMNACDDLMQSLREDAANETT